MPHVARIFFIAFASLAASCASERAQKEATEREEIGRQLTAAYYSCVRTSFASIQIGIELCPAERSNSSSQRSLSISEHLHCVPGLFFTAAASSSRMPSWRASRVGHSGAA
jgi:hypothetical protein